MRSIEIAKNDANQRLDKFILKRFKTMPKSLMYKYIRTKYIKVNGKKCDISTMLNEGDIITLYIKDEFFEAPVVKNYDFMKASTKLNIIYEDENIILLDKKQGLIVHPDKNYESDSLVYRLKNYLYKKGEYKPEEENSFAPALVNRIDRNTGGIVIGAKNAYALRELNARMKDRQIRKFYQCLVNGKMDKKEDFLIGYALKNENKNKVTISLKNQDGYKEIKTKYKVLKEFDDNTSLLEIELLTGRTHQIRAHLSFIGHPILGDTKYGRIENRNSEYKYQALYSYRIIFNFSDEESKLNYLNKKEFKVNDITFNKK